MLGRPGAQIRRHARYQVTSALPQKTSDHSKTEFKTMKLATLKDSTRDGRLVVVSRDLTRCSEVGHIARTLQPLSDLKLRTKFGPQYPHPTTPTEIPSFIVFELRPRRSCSLPVCVSLPVASTATRTADAHRGSEEQSPVLFSA